MAAAGGSRGAARRTPSRVPPGGAAGGGTGSRTVAHHNAPKGIRTAAAARNTVRGPARSAITPPRARARAVPATKQEPKEAITRSARSGGTQRRNAPSTGVQPMAWNTPLADHAKRAGAKEEEKANQTLARPLPASPKPTSRRVPVRSASLPTGATDREYTQKKPAAIKPIWAGVKPVSDSKPGTAAEKLTRPR